MSSTTVAPPPPPTGPDQPTNYLDLYGLSKPPFGESSDGTNYVLFGSHRRAFELLIDHAVNGSGLIILQGDEGIGKTETLRSAAAVAGESGVQTVVVARPQNGRLSRSQLVAALQGAPGTVSTPPADAVTQFLAPPRKVLFVDDIDLMPADCIALMLSLVQAASGDQPSGAAVVASTSSNLAADPSRADLVQLAGLARNTVRMSRLSASEVRQYIERSLWISGGTTRRLITADAMKMVIARSGGAPAVINRLMEAVLTAGFARGDTMITARTVAAATGLGVPRSRPRPVQEFEPPVRPRGNMVQIIAISLLVIGAAVFLYRGLSGSVSQPAKTASQSTKVVTQPDDSALSSAPSPAAPPQPSTVSQSSGTFPPELMAALMKRGDQSRALGDIAAARLLYERAANAGNAQASIALGKTYDPNYVGQGQSADPARAADWYQKAVALGEPQGGALLKQLGRH